MYPQDDDSVLSGIYTESGDSSVAHNTLDPEDDDEAFRRAVQAEQGRVMREFGLSTSNNNTSGDVTSVAEDGSADSGELRDKISSTPETYDEAYGVDDEDSDGNDDGSTFQPITLFSSSSNADMKEPTPDPILTPRRLKIIMVFLCVVFVASIAVAMGSFLAQKEGESPAQVRVDAEADTDSQVPDIDPLSTTAPASSSAGAPTISPTGSFNWKEGDCVDHPYKKFKINEQFGEQDCTFLRSHLDQRARLCLLEKEGYRWCPVTCGMCLRKFSPTISPTLGPLNAPTRVPVITPSITPSVVTMPRTTTAPAMSLTAYPTSEATAEPTLGSTAELTAAQTMPPTPEETAISTPAPSREGSSSYFCRTCPFRICEILPCD